MQRANSEAVERGRQAIVVHLQENGFRPEINAQGLVKFMLEGGHYYVLFDADDPGYVRLVFPKFATAADELERERVLAAAGLVNGRIKAAKVFLCEDRVWASVEGFLPDVAQFPVVFPRSLAVLRGAVHEFTKACEAATECIARLRAS